MRSNLAEPHIPEYPHWTDRVQCLCEPQGARTPQLENSLFVGDNMYHINQDLLGICFEDDRSRTVLFSRLPVGLLALTSSSPPLNSLAALGGLVSSPY